MASSQLSPRGAILMGIVFFLAGLPAILIDGAIGESLFETPPLDHN